MQVLMDNRMLEAQVLVHRESRLAAARNLLANMQVQMPMHHPAALQVSLLPLPILVEMSSHQHSPGSQPAVLG